ncbi:cell division protein ZipA C-terminal FtsZ-binding domain-containing protein [Bacterioplanoides sp. SCSIO 12839]|uniref:cell division protein ZipA C-terminal FtsZ-binding domain-containing protein n=1 Tax=Bacterioplanoides sp. SCSIO 12839 TaxID=2829569 RepID=UPI0021045BD3|nr:cell division protein ZipA C-terminal FtsZ-binding domain-containing protein [Bacterioplanoides sp. SCSIO 12839]UTW49566.1 hypothetical protein KFF03_06665 [Bacterioplanoides sp. SCSIO 12839]
MEWSWRTVMILIGLVVMIAILIDGFRRMRRARAEALRLDVSHDFKFPEEGYNPELPGEVRVVGETPATNEAPIADELVSIADESVSKASQVTEEQAAVTEPAFADSDSFENITTTLENDTADDIELPVFSALEGDELASTPEPEGILSVDESVTNDLSDVVSESGDHSGQLKETVIAADEPIEAVEEPAPVNLDEQVPVLLDVEELGEETSVVVETASTSAETLQAEEEVEEVLTANESTESVPEQTELSMSAEHEELLDDVETQNTVEEAAAEALVQDEMPEPLAETVQIITQPVNFAGSNAEILAHRPPAEVVLVIHAISRTTEGFKGSDLIYLFNSCDLRYGEKNIFHRFEEKDGEGCIQFSVSQSHEPGTFEPAKMADQTFRGLSFFMSLPGASRPLEAYEAMYEMAMVVSRNLQADVLDESQSALTPQTVEANREEIMTFERHQHLLMKKQGTR